MKRIQIDLSTETIEALAKMAEQHGHKVKPFVEYLVRMQIGAVPEPSVRPVNFAEDAPRTVAPAQENHEEETPQPAPRKSAAQYTHLLQPSAEEAPKRQPKPWTPNRNALAYTEETDTGSGIFTDGKNFAVQTGPTGRQVAHFFQFIHEAEEFKENQPF